mgnify:CR=1 FL=1
MDEQRSTGNGIGVAGFVVSLIGFLGCGLLPPVGIALSPIGLILSSIGMRKEPRGLAIAGLVLGILGSIGAALILVLFGLGFGLAALGTILAAVGLAAAAGQLEAGLDMAAIDTEVESYIQTNGSPPADLTVLGLDQDTLEDHWGNPYRYTLEGDGTWTLTSDGEDGTAGTNDDLTWDPVTNEVSQGSMTFGTNPGP